MAPRGLWLPILLAAALLWSAIAAHGPVNAEAPATENGAAGKIKLFFTTSSAPPTPAEAPPATENGAAGKVKLLSATSSPAPATENGAADELLSATSSPAPSTENGAAGELRLLSTTSAAAPKPAEVPAPARLKNGAAGELLSPTSSHAAHPAPPADARNVAHTAADSAPPARLKSNATADETLNADAPPEPEMAPVFKGAPWWLGPVFAAAILVLIGGYFGLKKLLKQYSAAAGKI